MKMIQLFSRFYTWNEQ